MLLKGSLFLRRYAIPKTSDKYKFHILPEHQGDSVSIWSAFLSSLNPLSSQVHIVSPYAVDKKSEYMDLNMILIQNVLLVIQNVSIGIAIMFSVLKN